MKQFMDKDFLLSTPIAQIYDADSEYASAYYFVTTLLCILTMPVFVWFYQL